MKMKEIDARGKPCPQPVLMTRKAIEEGAGELSVLVDNEGSAENVKRYAEKAGFQVKMTSRGDDLQLTLTGAGEVPTAEAGGMSKVLLITSDALGRDSRELGELLVKALLNTLAENDVLPGKIVLLNAGVKIACGESETVHALQDLEKRGVEILACGTCLDYYQLTEALKAGKISNAYEILNTLLEGDILPWS